MHITCETCVYFSYNAIWLTYNSNWLIIGLITLNIKKVKQILTLFH